MGLSHSIRAWTTDENTPDHYTGLTKKQKEAIRSTWKLLLKDSERHSLKIFLRLFRQYPNYRLYFLDSPGVKMSDLARDPGVQRHCRSFIKALDHMIVVTIKKPEKLVISMTNQAMVHKDMSLDTKDSERMANIIIDYFKTEFPINFTNYVQDCWIQFLDLLTRGYVDHMVMLQDADEKPDIIPARASNRKLSKEEREKELITEKEHQREFWKSKKSTWVEMDKKSLTIEDDEHEDSYINSTKNRNYCCVSSKNDENDDSIVVKPPTEREITEMRSLTAIKSYDGSHIQLSSDDSRSIMKEPISPIYNHSNASNRTVYHYKMNEDDLNSRRFSELYLLPQNRIDDQYYTKPSYVPGRDLDDYKVPLPPFMKEEQSVDRAQRTPPTNLRVTFNSVVHEYSNNSSFDHHDDRSTYCCNPRERRRRWNEFTSCYDKK